MNTVTTVDRALDVLMLFVQRENRDLGVTEIAQSLGLSKAVVHRMLSSFRSKGFLDIDEQTHRYRLGPNALFLGLAYMDRIEVRDLARPMLENLSSTTNETSTLSIRSGFSRVYVDQVTPERDVKMVVQLGKPWPLHAGASSKAFLAFLEAGEIDEYLTRKLERLTPLTITQPRALRKEIDAIRRAGYATSMGERLEGAGSVAAPVLDRAGKPAVVVSISGPVERMKKGADHAARLLVKATGELSRRLGNQNPL
jgi:IclR family acetate operon transcriptional repressor